MKSSLRSPRARAGIAALTCAAIVVVVIGIKLESGGGSGVAQGGPIEANGASGSILLIRIGQTWTDGQTALNLTGQEPAVITGVHMTGGDPALALIGVRVAGPERTQAVTQEFFSFPPRATAVTGPSTPAVGATIQPTLETRLHLGYELLIGYKFVGNSFSARSDIVVDYTVLGTPYEVTIPARLVLCPTSMTEKACEKRTNSMFPNG